MENFLPLIQTTLIEWLQLTIDHPLYAVTLVITVWIVTALLYSIKNSGLTKKNTINEQTRIAAEASLKTAQQQRQQAQDELAAAIEQQTQNQGLVDKEKQRALLAEQQLIKRNQHIAAIIQSLANSFDIGQRPLPVTEDLKADDLWQQHDKVIQQLIERLRNSQLATSIPVEQTAPVSTPESIDDPVDKLKSLFKKPVQQQPSKTITPPVVEQPVITPEPIKPQITEPVVKIAEQPVAPVETPKPATVRKFAPTKRLEVKPLSVEPSSRIDEAADLITENVDKLKGLYGKFFSKSE
jgi:hypothetical protein